MAGLVRQGSMVSIRPVAVADSAAILAGILQGGLSASVPGSEAIKGIGDAEAMLAGLVQKAAAGLELHFSICLQDGRVVGMCALYSFDPASKSSRIGYWIAMGDRRHGYGREAVRLLADIAFADRGIERIYASSDPSNEASMRLLRSMGFVEDDSAGLGFDDGETLLSLAKPR